MKEKYKTLNTLLENNCEAISDAMEEFDPADPDKTELIIFRRSDDSYIYYDSFDLTTERFNYTLNDKSIIVINNVGFTSIIFSLYLYRGDVEGLPGVSSYYSLVELELNYDIEFNREEESLIDEGSLLEEQYEKYLDEIIVFIQQIVIELI